MSPCAWLARATHLLCYTCNAAMKRQPREGPCAASATVGRHSMLDALLFASSRCLDSMCAAVLVVCCMLTTARVPMMMMLTHVGMHACVLAVIGQALQCAFACTRAAYICDYTGGLTRVNLRDLQPDTAVACLHHKLCMSA
jgi:hypothetical protein